MIYICMIQCTDLVKPTYLAMVNLIPTIIFLIWYRYMTPIYPNLPYDVSTTLYFHGSIDMENRVALAGNPLIVKLITRLYNT